MKNMTEIRWHGRGGQGAKTACLLLADAAFTVRQVSSRASRNTARSAWARPSRPTTGSADERCTVHSNIYEPDYVVVVDETLLDTVDVTAGTEARRAPSSSIPSAPPRSCGPCCRAMRAGCTPSTRASISEEHAGKILPQHPHAGRYCGSQPACVEPEEFICRIWRPLSGTNSPQSLR